MSTSPCAALPARRRLRASSALRATLPALALLGLVLPAAALTAGPASAAPTAGTPSGPPVATIGVVSFNARHSLSRREARRDAVRLTSRSDVDVVGWQEAERNKPVFDALERRGWRTRFVRGGAAEVAVSWRESAFTLQDSSTVKVADGRAGRFPDRWVSEVDLVHDATGEVLTVLDAHLPQGSEAWKQGRPGRWTDTYNARQAQRQLRLMEPMWGGATGRWVLGTGDYNFDFRADRRVRTPRGVVRTFAGDATSSFQALGTRGLPASHPFSGRLIDYVLAGTQGLRAGHVTFTRHRVLAGYRSDHRPVLARVELR